MVRASDGEILYKSQPESNSYTMGQSAGDCNLAGSGSDNISRIFLMKFVPPPTNLAVLPNAGITLFSYWTQGGYNFNADVWTVISNWTEAVSTWSSMIGSTADGMFSNVLGEKVGDINIAAADAFTGGRSPTGALDGAVIQDWLDNPGQNLGLALVNNPGSGYNSCIRTPWWGRNVNAAQNFEIYYDLVPEPVFLPIFAGLGFWAYRRMR
jgi:hypothetical protein